MYGQCFAPGRQKIASYARPVPTSIDSRESTSWHAGQKTVCCGYKKLNAKKKTLVREPSLSGYVILLIYKTCFIGRKKHSEMTGTELLALVQRKAAEVKDQNRRLDRRDRVVGKRSRTIEELRNNLSKAVDKRGLVPLLRQVSL